MRAERRRRSDLVAAALLVAAAGVGVVALALFSPAARSSLVPAVGPAPAAPAPPADVPTAVTELWRAPSAATARPVAVGPDVVTGGPDDGGATVYGRDPLTGRSRWSYHRDLPLCTVGAAWGVALAVFHRGAYCSEVTQLVPGLGIRDAQRNSDVRPAEGLFEVGPLVAAIGPDYLELWRSDLVRKLMYGNTRTDAQPDRQPYRECAHAAAAGAEDRLAVLERCPGEPAERLTVLRAIVEEPDRPEVEFSMSLPTAGAHLVAVGSELAAVLLPNPTRLSIRGADGAETASFPLDLPATDLATDPPAGVVPTADSPRALLWWTGSRTVGLDIDQFRPLWTVPGAMGPGAPWAGRLVIPVPAGLAVLDADTGRPLRTLPVDRTGWTGPVQLSTSGPVLLEQRGPTLVALG